MVSPNNSNPRDKFDTNKELIRMSSALPYCIYTNKAVQYWHWAAGTIDVLTIIT